MHQTASLKILTQLHKSLSTPDCFKTEREPEQMTAQRGDEQNSIHGCGRKTSLKDNLKASQLKGCNKHSANKQQLPNAAPSHRRGVQSLSKVSGPRQKLTFHNEFKIQVRLETFYAKKLAKAYPLSYGHQIIWSRFMQVKLSL